MCSAGRLAHRVAFSGLPGPGLGRRLPSGFSCVPSSQQGQPTACLSVCLSQPETLHPGKAFCPPTVTHQVMISFKTQAKARLPEDPPTPS